MSLIIIKKVLFSDNKYDKKLLNIIINHNAFETKMDKCH